MWLYVLLLSESAVIYFQRSPFPGKLLSTLSKHDRGRVWKDGDGEWKTTARREGRLERYRCAA